MVVVVVGAVLLMVACNYYSLKMGMKVATVE